jgi:hypothetical protein
MRNGYTRKWLHKRTLVSKKTLVSGFHIDLLMWSLIERVRWRKPRVEDAGAFYHVICRGNQRQVIFRSDADPLSPEYYSQRAQNSVLQSVAGLCRQPYRVSFFRPRNGLSPETETIFSPAATFNVNHMRCRLAGLQSISLRCD